VLDDRLGHPCGAAGTDLRALQVEAEGDYDLRGYLAIGSETRPGFRGIRYTVHVETDAGPEVLEDIRLIPTGFWSVCWAA
jgi:hypothetical protein